MNLSKEIDIIFDQFLDLIDLKDFQTISNLMDDFQIQNLPIELMLAPLAITVTWKNEIKSRASYFDRVAGEIVRRKQKDILEILVGLD